MSSRLTFNASKYYFDSSHTDEGIEFDTDEKRPINIKCNVGVEAVEMPPSANAPTPQVGHNALYFDSNDKLKVVNTAGVVESIGGTNIPFVIDGSSLPDNAEVFRIKDNNGVTKRKILEDGSVKNDVVSMAIFEASDQQNNAFYNITPTNQSSVFAISPTVNFVASSFSPNSVFTHQTNSDFYASNIQGANFNGYISVVRPMIVQHSIQIKFRTCDNFANPLTAYSAFGWGMGSGVSNSFYIRIDICQAELNGFNNNFLYAVERSFERECWMGGSGKDEYTIDLNFTLPMVAQANYLGSNGNGCGYNMRVIHNAGQTNGGAVSIQTTDVKWTLHKIADLARV